MRHFRQLMTGINPEPLLAQIENNPGLWSRNGAWTVGKNTAISDMAAERIELRYNRDWLGRPIHPREWNKPAWGILFEAKKIISSLQQAVGGIELLGRCIISRMAPGEEIRQHAHQTTDGSPKIYETVQIPLQVEPGVWFGCGDERLWMCPGTVWTFDNEMTHWVRNESDKPRISLMIDLRFLG